MHKTKHRALSGGIVPEGNRRRAPLGFLRRPISGFAARTGFVIESGSSHC
jgi:hypothetical protein